MPQDSSSPPDMLSIRPFLPSITTLSRPFAPLFLCKKGHSVQSRRLLGRKEAPRRVFSDSGSKKSRLSFLRIRRPTAKERLREGLLPILICLPAISSTNQHPSSSRHCPGPHAASLVCRAAHSGKHLCNLHLSFNCPHLPPVAASLLKDSLFPWISGA